MSSKVGEASSRRYSLLMHDVAESLEMRPTITSSVLIGVSGSGSHTNEHDRTRTNAKATSKPATCLCWHNRPATVLLPLPPTVLLPLPPPTRKRNVLCSRIDGHRRRWSPLISTPPLKDLNIVLVWARLSTQQTRCAFLESRTYSSPV